jgi:hypothetical protein
MGAKMVSGFDMAQKEGGIKAAMRLAMKVGFSNDKASGVQDSPENVQKMEAALKEILGKAVKL